MLLAQYRELGASIDVLHVTHTEWVWRQVDSSPQIYRRWNFNC